MRPCAFDCLGRIHEVTRYHRLSQGNYSEDSTKIRPIDEKVWRISCSKKQIYQLFKGNTLTDKTYVWEEI